MAAKIRVFGKAQSRTVLGIVNAYIIMNPNATLAELERVFPASFNSGLKAYKLTSNFLTPAILKGRDDSKIRCCFEDDPITLGDGSTIYLFSLWQKVDFDKVIEFAKSLSIEVADHKPTDGFEKGGYRLEYLNGYTPTPVVAKKGCSIWIWILLILIILGALAALFLMGDKEQEPAPAPVVVEEVAPVVVAQIKEIQTNFNDVKFDFNKAELKDDSKAVLAEIIALMSEHPNVKLTIVGHTSDEGSAEVNQILSEQRAQSVADYIISSGVASDRITSQGKGSLQPLDPNNREANRRTEFIVIK